MQKSNSVNSQRQSKAGGFVEPILHLIFFPLPLTDLRNYGTTLDQKSVRSQICHWLLLGGLLTVRKLNVNLLVKEGSLVPNQLTLQLLLSQGFQLLLCDTIHIDLT